MFGNMGGRPSQADKTKKELYESVARRIAKANPEMRYDEVWLWAKLAVKHFKKIHDIPSYSQVINMTHHELNEVLYACPESPFFASDF